MPTEEKDHRPEGPITAHAPSKDPLHGVTLEMMLGQLVAVYGWEEMGRTIRIRCFTHKPSISSSLEFLRRTAWAAEEGGRLVSGDPGQGQGAVA